MPNFILLWLVGAAIVLGACSGIDLQTASGQCDAARKALIVAESEYPDDADMLRRANLAVTLSCPVE